MRAAEGKLNSQLEIRDSSFALCRPALFHEREQMLQGFLIAAAFFSGELAGAFVELRGHLGGFFRRTTERDEDLGKLGNFHGNI